MKPFHLLVIAAFLPAGTTDPAWELKKHVPVLREVGEGDSRLEFEPAALPLRKAKGIAAHIRAGDPEEGSLKIFGVPGVADHFLVVAGGEPAGDDFGWRFLLYREQEDGYRRVFRGRGAGDSYMLRPLFFVGRDRILIFGEEGAEYTWGFSALEFMPGENSLREIGYLNVAKPLEDPWSTYSNPFDRGRVFLQEGRYVVEFDSDLILYPGQEGEYLLEGHGKPIRFLHDGKDFIPEKSADP